MYHYGLYPINLPFFFVRYLDFSDSLWYNLKKDITFYHIAKTDSEMIRKVSLKQIAQDCGFSVSLVSAVLSGRQGVNRCSGETSAKIKECARKLGYTPNRLAQAVVTGKSPIILLSLREEGPDEPEILNFYLNDLLIGGSRRFAAEGIYMLYMPYRTEYEQVEQIRTLAGSGIISGVIANIFSSTKDLPLYEYLEVTQLPAVILGFPKTDQVVSVGIDNTPIDRYIQEFALKNGYAEGKQIFRDLFKEGFYYQDGTPFRKEDVENGKRLIFAPGFSCYRSLVKHVPEILPHLVLLEDTRFYFQTDSPAILISSANPQAMALACELLVPWCREGREPEQKTHIIQRSMEHVQIIHPR